MSITLKEKNILRELAKRYKEIASLEIQEKKKKLWKKLNGLEMERPMVIIDQVCWNEMDMNDGLIPICSDPLLQHFEMFFRKKLYQWKHFPVDMIFDNWLCVPKAIKNTGFGIEVREEIEVTDPKNSVVSHKYENIFQTEEDLEKIKIPRVTHDEIETERRTQIAYEIFSDIIEIKVVGITPYLSLWDPLASWMGVENALLAMIDKPEYIHSILRRMTDGYLVMLDQLEESGLLCPTEAQTSIHCTGAYTNELPSEGYNAAKPRCKDIWMFGLAQMLGSVSPEMFEEFEITYTSELCKRFGLVYYGCCEPLDKKMKQVRKLPNVRKISMSPWADHQNGAKNIAKDFVFSFKPNPANLAMDSFDEGIIRKELSRIKNICKEYGCPLEIILKDLSTVKYDHTRLDKWAKIAMKIAEDDSSS